MTLRAWLTRISLTFVFLVAVPAGWVGSPLIGTADAARIQDAAIYQTGAATTVLDRFDNRMLELINGARAAAGVAPLAAATGLRSLALSWSNNMASGGTGGVLQHSPIGWARLPGNGASNATAWAENIAQWTPGTRRTAASIFNMYMASPGHRANILDPAMRFVGIGTVANSANVGFNTESFANSIDP